jgi:putative DNA methylase
MEAQASDLNPVAVLITKALIEIPAKFADRPPVNPESRRKMVLSGTWTGAQGLAEDIRYYGKWMRDQAERRIGHLYPKVRLPRDQGGGEATVIAWLWARTVKCPNPACGAQMPLVRSFWLSTNPNRRAWVEPIVDREKKTIRFEVRVGEGSAPEPTKIGRGAKFRCLVCAQPAEDQHIKDEGMGGRMGSQLMALVVETPVGRAYLGPNDEHANIATKAQPTWGPDAELPGNARWFSPPIFGFSRYRDLFTGRQLVALTTLSDLVSEARQQVLRDATDLGQSAEDHADAVATYLAFGLDKNAVTNCTLATWQADPDRLTQAFSRQALAMTWDFAEANPLSFAGGGFVLTLQSLAEVLAKLPRPAERATVKQLDATQAVNGVSGPLICTDPPYYDNIGYADLSDFFYVWLRKSIGGIYPDLFSTLLTPKAQELVATPYRFGGDRHKAHRFFEEGLGRVFSKLHEAHEGKYPLALFYAFKQTESNGDDGGPEPHLISSTGWETMLGGMLRAGFLITGTWPMRTELTTSLKRSVGALASSIVIICRPRSVTAGLATRREFVGALRSELPEALKRLQQGSIAPVDLAQASVGPGMAVFSRYARVVEADGSQMALRTALGLINQVLDEVLTEQESEYDGSTRWALAWFEQFGMSEGSFGDAETLAKAKNIAVSGLVEDGFLFARGNKVRILRREELDPKWEPATDPRLTVWEVTQHLIRSLDQDGEEGAARLLRKLGAGYGETARDLAYRLFALSERKGWAQEAVAYNSLVVAWPEVTRLRAREGADSQVGLFP